MKTVSGNLVSTKPISLSKAAKLLSRFTASDNEASPAFAAYLRRTSAAFNELVQLHKEYKIPLGDEVLDKKDRSSGAVTEGTANSVKIHHLPAVKMESMRDEVNDAMSAEKGMKVKISDFFNENVVQVQGILKNKSKKNKGSDVNVGVATSIKKCQYGANSVKVDKVDHLPAVDRQSMRDEVNDDAALSIDEKKHKKKDSVSDEKKHKKKQSHEAKERVETEAADKKASRKRKHERAADGELDGSQEAIRKKNKI